MIMIIRDVGIIGNRTNAIHSVGDRTWKKPKLMIPITLFELVTYNEPHHEKTILWGF